MNANDDYDDDDDYDEEKRYNRQPNISDPDGFGRRPECVIVVLLTCTEIEPKTLDQTERPEISCRESGLLLNGLI